MISKILPILILVFLYSGIFQQSVDALVDSAGQEIIEIRNPLKDLPTELEEEPSVERDDATYHAVTITSTTHQGHTKKDMKSDTALGNRRMNSKSKALDDEAKIEKELAELYKDTDYKSDADGVAIQANVTKGINTTVKTTALETSSTTKFAEVAVKAGKAIVRANKQFKFQPDDINNKAEVEKFRTSMDDIICDRQFTTEKMSGVVTPAGGKAKGAGVTYDPNFLLFLTIPLVVKLLSC